jgi:hypothetical protein
MSVRYCCFFLLCAQSQFSSVRFFNARIFTARIFHSRLFLCGNEQAILGCSDPVQAFRSRVANCFGNANTTRQTSGCVHAKDPFTMLAAIGMALSQRAPLSDGQYIILPRLRSIVHRRLDMVSDNRPCINEPLCWDL